MKCYCTKNSVSWTVFVFYPGVLALCLQKYNSWTDCIQLINFFPQLVDILQRIGVFPINVSSFRDNFEKLTEKSLPHDGDQWIGSLTGHFDVIEEDTAHANKIWNLLGIKVFDHCLILYLQTDVLRLADEIEKCRRLFVQVYGLDPSHCYSAPNICGMRCWNQIKWSWTSSPI